MNRIKNGVHQFQAEYLKQEIVNTKKKLGVECKFLAFETVKEKLFFKAKMGKDRVRIQINCKLEDIGVNEFNDLFQILNTKSYDTNEIDV